MPKVATVVPEDKSDRPIVNYIHRAGGRIRLQLAASEDVRDHKGRLVKKGETLYCDFVGGVSPLSRKACRCARFGRSACGDQEQH